MASRTRTFVADNPDGGTFTTTRHPRQTHPVAAVIGKSYGKFFVLTWSSRSDLAARTEYYWKRVGFRSDPVVSDVRVISVRKV